MKKKTNFGHTEIVAIASRQSAPVLAAGGVARSPTRDNNEENQLHQVGRDVIKGRFRGACVFIWYSALSTVD